MPTFSKQSQQTSLPSTPGIIPPAGNDGTTQPAAVSDGSRSRLRRFFNRISSISRGSSPAPDAYAVQPADNISVPAAQLAANVRVLGQLHPNCPTDSRAGDPERIVAADFASTTNFSSMTPVPTVVVSEHNPNGVNVVLDGFITVLRVTKEASDWNPFLKAAFGGVVAAIDLAKAANDNWQGMKEVMDNIQRLLPILQTSAKRLEGRHDGLEKTDNLMTFAIAIENELKKIQEMQTHGLFRRVLQGTTDADTLLGVYQNINSALEQFKVNLLSLA
ncbi:hypothetical protein H0H92_000239 [Tricholoma furcatifolium]|nr:hypothetical protein H0H92_000239 [Tricholoma furcatifolium]